MMVSATLLFLLGALAGSILADTKFVFTGAVMCVTCLKRPKISPTKSLCTRMTFVMTTSYLESMILHHIIHHLPSIHFYNITVTDSDDGLFDSHYEIVFMIVHDCTKRPGIKSLKARFEIGSFEITHGTHYIDSLFRLREVGTPWDKIIKRSTSATCPIGCNCEADG